MNLNTALSCTVDRLLFCACSCIYECSVYAHVHTYVCTHMHAYVCECVEQCVRMYFNGGFLNLLYSFTVQLRHYVV